MGRCCKAKQRKEPWLDGTLNTEYRKEYIEKDVPHEKQKKPVALPTAPAARFDGATTYDGDYKTWESRPPRSMRPQGGEKENLPFYGDSTYKAAFEPKEVPYERVKPKHSFEPSKDPIDGLTTQKQDYKDWGTPAVVKVGPRHQSVGRLPFEGQSLYKDTFTKQPYAKRDLAAPLHGSELYPKGPFDDKTLYKSSYVPKEVPVPERHRPEGRPRTPGEWYGGAPGTEYRGQFIEKAAPPPQPVRPAHGALSAGPFDGTTTYGDGYRPYSSPGLVKAIRPSQQEKEPMPFNGYTTYGGAFTQKDVPYERVRPKHSFEPSKDPFDGTTTHKTNFQNWGPQQVLKVGPNRQARERLPFEGSTTYKHDFTKMPKGLRYDAKPNRDRAVETGPFDGATTYKVDYIKKEVPRTRPFHPDGCESCTDGSDNEC